MNGSLALLFICAVENAIRKDQEIR